MVMVMMMTMLLLLMPRFTYLVNNTVAAKRFGLVSVSRSLWVPMRPVA